MSKDMLALETAVPSNPGLVIVGNPGPDYIPDTPGDDSITGLGGDDTVVLRGGFDTVDGGADEDTLVLDTSGLAGDLEISLSGAGGTSSPDGSGGVARNFPDGTFEGLRGVQFRSIEHFQVVGGDANEAILGPNPGVRPFFADTISAGAGNDFVGLGFSRASIDLGTGYNGATLDRSNATNDLHFDMPHGVYSGVEGLSGSLNYVETLKTGSGNDSIITGVIAGNLFADDFLNTQIIYAGAGNDTVVSSGDEILAYGGDGTDTIVVDASAAMRGISAYYSATDLSGVTGSSTFTEFSGFEHEQITGGAGADSLQGGAGADTLSGGAAADTIDGGAGADVMIGGSGSDTYYVDSSGDRTIEQAGGGTLDVVHTTLGTYQPEAYIEAVYYDGTGVFHGDAPGGGAIYAGNASRAYLTGHGGGAVYGGAGDDSIQERAGALGDRLYGGDGNDHFTVHQGDGHPTISGGGGFDLLTYDAFGFDDLIADLTKVGFQAVGDGTVFQGIEQLHFTGGGGNDLERGGAAADVLKGGVGSDTLIGGGGADTLEGDGGHDTLTGGAGGDTFRFIGLPLFSTGDPADDADTVTDFTIGADRLELRGFSPGPGGFDVVSAADGPFEAKGTVIVDTVNHTLSYDRDGTGAKAAELLAHGDFSLNPLDYTVS